MSPKSRDVIWGGRIMGAEIRAQGAREAAQKAAKEADKHQMKCLRCADSGWVWESHNERLWEGKRGCGGAGAPCFACDAPAKGEMPRLLADFETVFDKKGWRH